MHKLIYSILFIFCCASSIAQQSHFIYIQAESNQSFYVKLNDQIYSSAFSGYVILPKLRDGSYTVKIGFSKGDGVLQNFVCKIDRRDQGYLLKNLQKGWALFDLQTLNVTMAGTNEKIVSHEETKTNTFSSMLSDAVNDPSLTKDQNPNVVAIVTPRQTIPATANSNCKGVASDDDFLKLRKKMADANSDADMLIDAKKVFQQKCFTTDQIKNLSVLFLKDEGKYNFFDAAYPYTIDGNFNLLQNQLTDNYYISRFRVMVRQ
jgi:hypothetical protein